jgi:hypothetical protein
MQAQALHGREITGSVTQLVSTGGGNTVFFFLNMEKQEQELNQVDQSPRFVWFAGDANPAWQMAGLSWSLLFLGGC